MAILNTHPPYSESMNFIIEVPVKGFMDFIVTMHLV